MCLTPTEAILESISDGVFTIDLQWRVTSFNRSAEEITGVMRREALGRLCSEVFRSNMCGADCALKRCSRLRNPSSASLGSSSMWTVNDSDQCFHRGDSGLRGSSCWRSGNLSRSERSGGAAPGIGRTVPHRDLVSRSPIMQKVFEVFPPWQPARHGFDPGRNRDRKGKGGAHDPLLKPAPQRAFRGRQLRRASGYPPGIGAFADTSQGRLPEQ